MARRQRIVLLNLSSDKSDATSDEMDPLHVRRPSDSIDTTVKNIKMGNTPTQLKKQKKLKDNKSLSDWWHWYWQNPISRLPFFYFTILLLATPVLSVFWFMDNDSCFIVTGATVLFMSAYAIHKFRTLIGLKREVNKFRDLNRVFRKEVAAVTNEIQRVLNAHRELKSTKQRITKANAKNKENLHLFSTIEANMQIVGQKQIKGMSEVHGKVVEMKDSWRKELLNNERNMLNSAYERFEQTGHRQDGVTQDEFRKLAKMLPPTYSKRFARMGTFHTFAQGGTVIDFEKFANAIDLYATMEIDNIDLDPTPYVTPQITPLHTPWQSPFNVFDALGSMELQSINSMSLGLNPTSLLSNNSLSEDHLGYPGHQLLSPSAKNNEKKLLLPKFQE